MAITTRIWHQASPRQPCSSTSECGCSPGSTGDLAFGGVTQPLPGVLPAGKPPLPMWPEEPRTPLSSWGFALATRALPGIKLHSSDSVFPLFIVLVEFKPSPFSLFSSVPAAVSTFPLSLQLLFFFWGGVLFPYSPLPHLCPLSHAKAAPCPLWLLSSQFTSPHCVPAEFCGSGCADCCVNPQIGFLGVQDDLVLIWLSVVA